jgi:hypothetical protein
LADTNENSEASVVSAARNQPPLLDLLSICAPLPCDLAQLSPIPAPVDLT